MSNVVSNLRGVFSLVAKSVTLLWAVIITGLDVLSSMRGDVRWKSLPCIILTAAGQEEQHQRALELGASEFLTKPFSPKKLYQRAAELAGLAPQDAGADSE